MKEAYNAKKWAFVSDYARLDIIYNEGGIYLDTDVELIKNLDCLLDNKCFLAVDPPSYLIATGLGFGAEKSNENIKAMLDEYNGLHFELAKGVYDKINCPARNSKPFYKYGFSTDMSEPTVFNGAKVYTSEYFAPYNRKTHMLNITENTLSLHRYSASWIDDETKIINTKVAEYSKTHSKLATKIYKNMLECKKEYSTVNFFTLIKLIKSKIRKKIILKKYENKDLNK
jgi:hypothetical protein